MIDIKPMLSLKKNAWFLKIWLWGHESSSVSKHLCYMNKKPNTFLIGTCPLQHPHPRDHKDFS